MKIEHASMFARFGLPSLLIGISAYATLVLFEMLRFWLSINLHPHTGDAAIYRALAQMPKSPVAVAVGIACALAALAVLYVVSLYYGSIYPNHISR